MALELVGGAFLSASFQVVIERMASLEIFDSIWGKQLNDGLFKELKIMLLSANAVVNDAEQKQIGNPYVRAWLHELQAAVYDAEDLVQAIEAEALRCKMEAEYGCSSSSHRQVLNLLPMPATSFKEQVESKMRELIDTLKFILDQKVHLGLKEGFHTISSKRILATSSVEESGVYGRDDDKEAIIDLLLATDESSGEKFSVIPIVGMGGIGKTTLAQLVYNDERVKKCFGFKAWVSVSYEFDIFKITKLITERVANSRSFYNSDDLDLLQVKLQEALEGKKFLLVLDDVWNEDYFQWEELKKPFERGACGSKIIVTTRNESVSSVMRNNNIPSFQIQTMSNDNCWKLFVKHAFVNVDPCCHPKLEEIGRQIVQKCKGLPLAVKSLGCILRYQLRLEEWETILKSDIWDLPKQKNSIIPALWLSYHYLPSKLKRCFAYCSVFPKNYEIDKDNLIKLWMAEDLLQPQNNKRIEKVGEEYFDDLLSRSLFQKSKWFGTIYTMHDLVHDLAKFVAGDFCLSLNGNNWDKLLSKVRHLSHLRGQIHSLEKYEDLLKAKCLRTFFFPSTCYGEIPMQLKNLEAMKLWSTLTCLRSLSFCGCSIVKLSPSIGNLKLLRYLNLSGTTITEVPNTVCSLYNLQTLILSGCKRLTLLPTEMGRLINLRHLDITSTGVERMPFEVGNLKNLQTLTEFVVGKYSGYTIWLLKDLQNLHGQLCFRGLENIVKVEDALVANLKEMKFLERIEFRWSSVDSGDNSLIMHRDVLNGLEPHTILKDLIIRGYGGEKFPNWVGHPSFSNLEKINLVGCRECSMLPPLGQLPFLKHLRISGFDEVVKVGNEFYCGGCSVPTRPFRCLKSLNIYGMKKCEEWSFNIGEDGDAAFPELATFALMNCPRLNVHMCFPNMIEEVNIGGCRKFELSGKQQQRHRNSGELCITGCEFVDSIALDYFPMFTSLRLKFCGNLKSLTYSQQPPETLSLKRLDLICCRNLQSFPTGGLHAPNLEKLEISDCDKLKSLPENMKTLLPSLHELYLRKCPELESLPECSMPSNLRELHIWQCNKFLASRRHWDLQSLPSLSSLSIRCIVEVLDSFPEEGLLPATLINLTINSLRNLKALNGKALRHLSSLEELEISECYELQCLPEEGLLPNNLVKLRISWLPSLNALDGKAFRHLSSLQYLTIHCCEKLQCLPEEGLPASLSKLDIFGCPMLNQRCQRETGEDWPKIAHIPHILIH